MEMELFVAINDEQRLMNEYAGPTAESMKPYGGKLLAVDTKPDVKEGDWPAGRTIIYEFPDMESATGWYHSEEYAPLLKLRGEIADTNLAFVSGV